MIKIGVFAENFFSTNGWTRKLFTSIVNLLFLVISYHIRIFYLFAQNTFWSASKRLRQSMEEVRSFSWNFQLCVLSQKYGKPFLKKHSAYTARWSLAYYLLILIFQSILGDTASSSSGRSYSEKPSLCSRSFPQFRVIKSSPY